MRPSLCSQTSITNQQLLPIQALSKNQDPLRPSICQNIRCRPSDTLYRLEVQWPTCLPNPRPLPSPPSLTLLLAGGRGDIKGLVKRLPCPRLGGDARGRGGPGAPHTSHTHRRCGARCEAGVGGRVGGGVGRGGSGCRGTLARCTPTAALACCCCCCCRFCRCRPLHSAAQNAHVTFSMAEGLCMSRVLQV